MKVPLCVKSQVCSFALCAPLFANVSLKTAFDQHGLGSNLHTIWMEKDASPAFFSFLTNLASKPDPTLEPLPAGSNDVRIKVHLNSVGFRAAQACALALQRELQKLPRSSDPHFASSAQPLSKGELDKAANVEVRKSASGAEETQSAGLSGTKKATLIQKARAVAAIAGATAIASRTSVSSVASAGHSHPAPIRKSTSDRATTSDPQPSMSGSGTNATARSIQSSKARSMSESASSKGDAVPQKQIRSLVAAAAAGGTSAGSEITWKAAFAGFLACVAAHSSASPAANPSSLHPVGQFWVLQSSANSAPEISLVHVEESRVATLSSSWLSDNNKEMLMR